MLFEPFLAGRAAEMRQGNTTSLCSLAIFDRKVNWASEWTLLFICRILADMRIRQSVDFNLCAARWIELLASSLFYLLSSHLGAHQPLKAFRRLWLPLWMLIPYGPYCFGGFLSHPATNVQSEILRSRACSNFAKFFSRHRHVLCERSAMTRCRLPRLLQGRCD